MIDFKQISSWGDGNITAALYWSQDFGLSASPPVSLKDSGSRAIFVEKLNQAYGVMIGTKYIENKSGKGRFLKEVVEFSKKLLSDIKGSDEEIASLVFKLWGSCILTSKFIDKGREEKGEITPEIRKEKFILFDTVAKVDPIYKLGMETAISYCKLNGEDYTLNGVPPDSPVRV